MFTVGNISVVMLGVLALIFGFRVWKVQDSKALIRSIYQKRSTLIEFLLVIINMIEAIVAMSVVNDTNVPESVRLIMHLAMASMSAVFGFGIFPQINDIFSAFAFIIKGKFRGNDLISTGINGLLALANIFKQTIDAYLAIVMSVIGPLGNWILICYFEGDLKVSVNLNDGFFPVLWDFVRFKFNDHVNLIFDNSLEAWSISSFIVIIIHLLALAALSFFSFDFGIKNVMLANEEEKEEEAEEDHKPVEAPKPVVHNEIDWTDDETVKNIDSVNIKDADVINYTHIYTGTPVEDIRQWLSVDNNGIITKMQALRRKVLQCIFLKKQALNETNHTRKEAHLHRVNDLHEDLRRYVTLIPIA